jgi:hypothetical protein
MDNLGRTGDTVGTRDFGEQTTTRLREEQTAVEAAGGGSMLVGIAGLAAVVLTIIGLTNVYPLYLEAVAVIVLGVGLLAEAGSLVSRFSAAFSDMSANVSNGASAQFMAGVAGIVLGILSLLQIAPAVLLPVAIIVFGAGILLTCATMARLNTLSLQRDFSGHDLSRRMTGDMVGAAGGAEVLVGVAAIVLGIVGLCGWNPLVLSLVGGLCLGVAMLFSGAAVGSRMMTAFRR